MTSLETVPSLLKDDILYLTFGTFLCRCFIFTLNIFYRFNGKAVERLDGRMLLRLQDLRKEVNCVFFPFRNALSQGAVYCGG